MDTIVLIASNIEIVCLLKLTPQMLYASNHLVSQLNSKMEEVKCCTNLLEDDTKVVNHWTGEELQSHQQAFRC